MAKCLPLNGGTLTHCGPWMHVNDLGGSRCVLQKASFGVTFSMTRGLPPAHSPPDSLAFVAVQSGLHRPSQAAHTLCAIEPASFGKAHAACSDPRVSLALLDVAASGGAGAARFSSQR